jgi:hypothetical protein
MERCPECPTIPPGSVSYPPARDRIHEMRRETGIILDFPRFAKFTWEGSMIGSLTRRVLADRPSRKILCRATTFARQSKAVARAGDPPQSGHTGSPCLATTIGPASGKEIPMGKTTRSGHCRRFSRLGEKNITRCGPHTLRLRLPCDDAGIRSAFSLIHGATDANGR